jgi:membrane fusion protein (multidrug efflux system)
MYASIHEDTDDAYVTGYTHQISSRITGTVEEVLVDDNWHVTAGQPLIKLDPRDYEVASQTGEAMILIGLPQLLIFPFVPRLMKALDLRLIVFAGMLIFGGFVARLKQVAPLRLTDETPALLMTKKL